MPPINNKLARMLLSLELGIEVDMDSFVEQDVDSSEVDAGSLSEVDIVVVDVDSCLKGDDDV